LHIMTEVALKSRLARRGVRVPIGLVITSEVEAEHAIAELGLPVMVKALVAAKDRAQLGLVRHSESLATSREYVKQLLVEGQSGLRVERILIEQVAPEGEEFYLAAGFDYVRGEPILLYGPGGSGVERRAEPPKKIMATMSGTYEADEIPLALRPVANALLAEFLELRAQLVELNPVRVCSDGPIVLDAKAVLDPVLPLPSDAITIDDDDEIGTRLRDLAASIAGGTEVRFGRLDGDVGMVSGGGGVLSIVSDAMRKHGLRPANFSDVSGGAATTRLLGSIADEVVKLKVRGILVVTGITSSVSVTEFAETMLKSLLPLTLLEEPPPVVARMAGIGEEEAAVTLRALPNCTTVGMDVTVEEAVALLYDQIGEG